MGESIKNIDVLITDASQRVALELTRSLGRLGLVIHTVERKSTQASPISSYSKHCQAFHLVKNYVSDDFRNLCQHAQVIIPVSTNTILAVINDIALQYPDRFLLPTHDVFKKVNSKQVIANTAEKIGIGYPKTRVICFDNDTESEDIKKSIKFPMVIKLIDDEGLYLAPQFRYKIVKTNDEFKTAIQKLSIHQKDLVIQEYIEGPSYGWSAIYDNAGKCAAHFAHKRLREYPISGGPSTFCESVKCDKLTEAGKQLLDSFNWVGPAMVEFKLDIKNDIYKVIEINPRYWGSLPLARAAGLNLPSIHYKILREEPLPELDYCENIKLRFRITDTLAALSTLRHTQQKISFLLKYIPEYFDFRITEGLWSWSDPLPWINYVTDKLNPFPKQKLS